MKKAVALLHSEKKKAVAVPFLFTIPILPLQKERKKKETSSMGKLVIWWNFKIAVRGHILWWEKALEDSLNLNIF